MECKQEEPQAEEEWQALEELQSQGMAGTGWIADIGGMAGSG